MVSRRNVLRRQELELDSETSGPKASTPNAQTDAPQKLTPEEIRRAIEANPRFKKAAGKDGEAFIVPGAFKP